jgi:hypothetical protein
MKIPPPKNPKSKECAKCHQSIVQLNYKGEEVVIWWIQIIGSRVYCRKCYKKINK